MVKTKKLIIFLMLVSCFFILISSASAADFHVKDKTTHKDITNWMKNAKKGDNLIFDRSSYNLTNTLKINKAINVKSSKNTKINFSRNKAMFHITTSSKVTFSGLTLNYNGKGTDIKPVNIITASNNSYKKINFNKINIKSNKNYVGAIEIPYWEGSVSKSKITMNGVWGRGISSEAWKGNLINSHVSIKSPSVSVYSLHWDGKVTNSKIYNYGSQESWIPVGILFVFAKGTISKCTVVVPNGEAVKLDRNVKVSGCSIKSKPGYQKIHRFLPDLSIGETYYKEKSYSKYNIKRSGSTYSITISNGGLATSNTCYLGIKIGNYVKTVKVKALNSGQSTTVKIKIPTKYISSKYTKTIKIDYYNKVKEVNETNNILQSKTPEKEIRKIQQGIT